MTNLVARPSRGIGDLKPADHAAGQQALGRKIKRFRPEVVAFVGVTLYQVLFQRRARNRGAAQGRSA